MYDSQFHAQRMQASIAERQQDLIARLVRWAPVDGIHATQLAGLRLIRRNAPTPIHPAVYEPSLGIVVQGRKRSVLNGEVYHYDALQYLVCSVRLPVLGQIIEASPEAPYLSVGLQLDLDEIGRLLLELGDRGQRPALSDRPDRGVYVARMDESLLDAVLRLVRLLDTPEELTVLAPAVQREIYYRVLRGELGQRLVALAEGDGGQRRVQRAIEWLTQHYAEPMRIETLAEAVHMSPSALHHRFKAVTAMSPLQYQKQLRLHEARRLMYAEGADCAGAAHRVGYESPSQFSREYRRLFGAPPSQEIARLRGGEVLI